MVDRPDGGTGVLVPGVAAPSSLATVRSLGRQGARPIVVTDDPSRAVCRSRYVHEVFELPAPTDDLAGYREGLVTLAGRRDVVTIAPLREAESYVLARDRGRFEDLVATPWPDYETVHGVQDWLQLRDAARGADVAVPETARVDAWDGWDQRTVVKSRYSVLEADNRLVSPGVRFFEAGGAPDVDALAREMGHVPIAQAFVPGEEFGYFALFDQGSPVASFQHRRVRSYTYAGGASVYRRSVDIDPLRRAGERLLRSLEWHGPAMVEFKRDADGTFRLMEINPRFWGSLPLAVHAGVDFPWLYYQLALGLELPPETGYRVGVGSHLLRGELSYLHSVARYRFDHVDRPWLPVALARVTASVLREPTFDVLSRDDPRPFVRDIAAALAPFVPATPSPLAGP